MSASAWTPEKVEQLKALVNEGLTFREIGAAIGMGRCSCIGKAHRLGLRRGEEAKHPRGSRKPLPDQVKPTPPPAPAPPPSAGQPVLIHQLEPHHCRFPLGATMDPPPYRYCGATAIEPGTVPYCEFHAAIAYQRRAA